MAVLSADAGKLGVANLAASAAQGPSLGLVPDSSVFKTPSSVLESFDMSTEVRTSIAQSNSSNLEKRSFNSTPPSSARQHGHAEDSLTSFKSKAESSFELEINQRIEQSRTQIESGSITRQDLVKQLSLEYQQKAKADLSSINAEVHFEFDKHSLSSKNKAAVGELAKAIKEMDENPLLAGQKINVSGHTDSKGSDQYNMALSQRRAEAIKAELVAQGIPEDRIVLSAHGEGSPKVLNEFPNKKDNIAGRAVNRRVEVGIDSAGLESEERLKLISEQIESLAKLKLPEPEKKGEVLQGTSKPIINNDPVKEPAVSAAKPEVSVGPFQYASQSGVVAANSEKLAALSSSAALTKVPERNESFSVDYLADRYEVCVFNSSSHAVGGFTESSVVSAHEVIQTDLNGNVLSQGPISPEGMAQKQSRLDTLLSFFDL